jgi:hypothetical protein
MEQGRTGKSACAFEKQSQLRRRGAGGTRTTTARESQALRTIAVSYVGTGRSAYATEKQRQRFLYRRPLAGVFEVAFRFCFSCVTSTAESKEPAVRIATLRNHK